MFGQFLPYECIFLKAPQLGLRGEGSLNQGPATMYLSNCIFKKEKCADLLQEVGSELTLMPGVESIILIALVVYGYVDI